MSFGDIDIIINKVKKTLEEHVSESSINYNELINIKKQIYKQIQNKYPTFNIKLIDDVINRFISCSYSYNNINFNNGTNCFREWEETYDEIKVPKKYKKLEEHFQKLKNIPQPAQRTKEWFDYRHNRITASDTAAAIDLNPYEPVESFIIKKCDPDYPFLDNATVFHGKKYEQVATLIYEHIYNNRVYEFGALPSELYPFLGASPDGICSKYSIDNKFSDRLGTMLEIKCPVRRRINTKGEIAGNICPFYYYCQVQQQLACCELTNCDFWQCKISEYNDYNEYHQDIISSSYITIGTNAEKLDIDKRLKKGIILEFYPKTFVPQFEGDLAEWKSKYIYPKRLDMNEEQYNAWTLDMLNNYKTLYPDIASNYYFYRIIYWKLDYAHNVTIERDDNFFQSILPILKDTWSKVLYYREHLDELDTLKKIIEERKANIHPVTTFTIHNNLIIQDKCLLLDENTDLKKYISKPPTKYNYYKKEIVQKKEIIQKKEIDSDHENFVESKIAKEILGKKVITKKKITKTKEVVKPKKLNINSIELDGCHFVD